MQLNFTFSSEICSPFKSTFLVWKVAVCNPLSLCVPQYFLQPKVREIVLVLFQVFSPFRSNFESIFHFFKHKKKSWNECLECGWNGTYFSNTIKMERRKLKMWMNFYSLSLVKYFSTQNEGIKVTFASSNSIKK